MRKLMEVVLNFSELSVAEVLCMAQILLFLFYRMVAFLNFSVWTCSFTFDFFCQNQNFFFKLLNPE